MKRDFVNVFLLVLVLTFNAQCQDSIPFYEMKIYFQDAIGNRDTIEVGYDEEASGDFLNPQFGEIPLITPFDSVFEVRATHFWGEHTLKRIIGSAEYEPVSGCRASTGVWIFFKAQHFPVTITYDSTLLNSFPCHTDALFSPSWTIYTYPYWWNAEMFYCLSNTDVIVDDFAYYFKDPGAYLRREFEVEGQAKHYLPGYFFEIFLPEGYCHSLVRTTSLYQTASNIYPNPAQDHISISLQEDRDHTISIINAYGQTIWAPTQCTEQELLISTETFTSGQYYLLIEDQDRTSVQKLIIVK